MLLITACSHRVVQENKRDFFFFLSWSLQLNWTVIPTGSACILKPNKGLKIKKTQLSPLVCFDCTIAETLEQVRFHQNTAVNLYQLLLIGSINLGGQTQTQSHKCNYNNHNLDGLVCGVALGWHIVPIHTHSRWFHMRCIGYLLK